MDATLATKQQLEPSDARFSLRGMLLATFVVALFAAIGGPFGRSLGREEQFYLLTVWGLCFVGAVQKLNTKLGLSET
jgi:hypothetical protein